MEDGDISNKPRRSLKNRHFQNRCRMSRPPLPSSLPPSLPRLELLEVDGEATAAAGCLRFRVAWHSFRSSTSEALSFLPSSFPSQSSPHLNSSPPSVHSEGFVFLPRWRKSSVRSLSTIVIRVTLRED